MHYIKQLTFLRFLAAMLVVVFHFGKESLKTNISFLQELINQGSIAVSFFFFLSGVVLAYNYFYKKDLLFKSFIRKRLARIYPIYLFAFLASLLLAMYVNNAYPKGLSIILQGLGLHAWVPGICLEINFPAWSLSVELFFYICFPLLASYFRKLKRSYFIVITIVLWGISAMQHYWFSTALYQPNNNFFGQFNLYFPLWHLSTFISGMLCGVTIKDALENGYYKLTSLRLIYIGSMICFLLIVSTKNPIRPYIHNGLLAPIYFALITGLALDKSLLTKLLGHPSLMFLGNISYSIYILQWPVYLLFLIFIPKENLINYNLWLYYICLILISAICNNLIEQKAKKYFLR